MAHGQALRVGNDHRITVPRRVREQLGIRSGDHLLVEVRGNVIMLLPEPADNAAEEARRHAPARSSRRIVEDSN